MTNTRMTQLVSYSNKNLTINKLATLKMVVLKLSEDDQKHLNQVSLVPKLLDKVCFGLGHCGRFSEK